MQTQTAPAEQRNVFNAVYLVGKHLDRKFETSDLTPELRQAARMYAASYEGDFDYMVGMRDQIVAGTGSFFTDNQSKGILNCLMADAKRRIAAKPQATVTDHAGRVYLSTVPDGRYRVTLPSGENLVLKITLATKESKLAGARIISSRISSDEWMGFAHITPAGELKLWRSLVGDRRDRVVAAVNTLDDAKAEDAWLVAGLAFAQEGSQCFFCGRDLDTPESLLVGYGPTCADKHGLPWGEKVIPMSVRLAQAATEVAPAVDETYEAAVADLTPVKESAYDIADRDNRTSFAHMQAVRASGRKLTYADVFPEDSI